MKLHVVLLNYKTPQMTAKALDHLMVYGNGRPLTEEDLANAVTIDPSQIAGLGPSLEALIQLLEERRRKILETYDPGPALEESRRGNAAVARAYIRNASTRSVLVLAVVTLCAFWIAVVWFLCRLTARSIVWPVGVGLCFALISFAMYAQYVTVGETDLLF